MQTVDLRQVKTIMAKAAGKEPPTFERSLFWYTKFVYVEKSNYKILSEKEALEIMQRYTPKQLEVFLLKFPQSQTPVPSIISNRRGLQTEPCTSHERASEIIYLKTGVKVPEGDLISKQKMNMKDNRPLVDQLRDFRQSNKARIVALVECEQIKDAKKRAECINNKCKIK